MKQRIKNAGLVFTLVSAMFTTGHASNVSLGSNAMNIINSKTEDSLPSKAEVLNVATRVNDLWQSERAFSVLDRNWYSGVYHAANMDLYRLYPVKAYLDYSHAWAVHNTWGVGTHASADADNYAVGQTYIDLYSMDAIKDPVKISAIKARVDSKLSDTRSAEWWWIDAMYMAMPTYARMGVLTGDSRYYEKMYQLYKNCRDTLLVSPNTVLWTTAFRNEYGTGPIIDGYGDVPDGLYSPEDGLWWRDWGFQPGVPPKRDPNNGNNSDTDPFSENCAKSTPNGKKIFWGRGNGWVIGAMARTLAVLPEDAPHRDEYVNMLRNMAISLKGRQRSDGFWNMSLDDPNDRPGGETSGTAFITYAIAWGINNGVLDRDEFYPVVAKAWNGLVALAVDGNGVLLRIQGEGEAPINPSHLITSRHADKKVAFGVGAFISAASEVARLAPGEMPELPPVILAIEQVSLLSESRLHVRFSAEVDAVSAQNPSNYLVSGAPEILEVEMDGASSVVLTFSDAIDFGRYTVRVTNVTGEDGSLMDEAGSESVFVRTVPLAAVDYPVTVTASGSQTGNPPAHTIDNSIATRWAQAGLGQWIRFDLGEEKMVYAVDIAYYLGNTRFARLAIQTSSDGVNYTTVLDNQTSSGMTNELERYRFPETVKARYIRIICNGNSSGGENWNSITEVRIRFDVSSGVAAVHRGVIRAYPNPFKQGELTIETGLKIQSALVEVTDISGRSVYANNVDFFQGKASVFPKKMVPGVYLLSVSGKDQKYCTELLIE